MAVNDLIDEPNSVQIASYGISIRNIEFYGSSGTNFYISTY